MIKIKRIEGIEISIPWWVWLLMICVGYYLLSGDSTYLTDTATGILNHFTNR